MGYVYLAIAILAEVIATTALKSSASFTRLAPSMVVILGYGVAFFALSLCVKTVTVGVAYAVWAGLGIVLITIAGYLVHGQAVDLPAALGMALIVTGVVVIQLFSKAATQA